MLVQKCRGTNFLKPLVITKISAVSEVIARVFVNANQSTAENLKNNIASVLKTSFPSLPREKILVETIVNQTSSKVLLFLHYLVPILIIAMIFVC